MKAWMLMVALFSVAAGEHDARASAGVTLNGDLEAQTGVVGIAIAKSSAPYLVVQDVVAGGPAAAAGIQAQDLVIAIDDVDTESMSLDEAVTRVRGVAGQGVKLSLVRGETHFDLTLVRVAAQDLVSP